VQIGPAISAEPNRPSYPLTGPVTGPVTGQLEFPEPTSGETRPQTGNDSE
jgi:hypothetical protein